MVLCDNLEGWDVAGVGGVQDGGNICTPMVDSCCCMADTNAIL